MTASLRQRPSLTHVQLTEPALAFDPADTAQQHLNPLAGLARFGPYSATAWEATGQRVRVAILAPFDAIDPLRDLLNGLRSAAEPRERHEYLPPYPGFRAVFRTGLVPAEEAARQPLPEDLDGQLAASAAPHTTVAQALTGGLTRLVAVRGRREPPWILMHVLVVASTGILDGPRPQSA